MKGRRKGRQRTELLPCKSHGRGKIKGKGGRREAGKKAYGMRGMLWHGLSLSRGPE